MKITARFELIAYMLESFVLYQDAYIRLGPVLALSIDSVIIEFIPKIVFKVN